MRIGAAVLVALIAFVLFVSLIQPGGSPSLLQPGDFARVHNDTNGAVIIQARCPRFLRQYNVCDFRDLPLLGYVPTGAAVILPPQPPPGETTWFRIGDDAHRVLGCVSVRFAPPNQPASIQEIPDVNVTQLKPCPDWSDDP